MISSPVVLLLCVAGALSAPHHGHPVGKLPISPVTHKQHLGIVGGHKTSISKYPYIASVDVDGALFGAAVILNENWLLTTGWTTYQHEKTELSFRVGSTYDDKQGQVLKASKVIPHPKYTAQGWDYDIAVIKTDKPIKFNKNVKAIKGLATKPLKAGTKAYTAGWGDIYGNGTYPGYLEEAEVTVATKKTCANTYESDLTPRLFCTLDKTVAGCIGDFSDPVVVDDVVYGLFAGGYACVPNEYPILYTDVAALHKWVQSTIKSEESD